MTCDPDAALKAATRAIRGFGVAEPRAELYARHALAAALPHLETTPIADHADRLSPSQRAAIQALQQASHDDLRDALAVLGPHVRERLRRAILPAAAAARGRGAADGGVTA